MSTTASSFVKIVPPSLTATRHVGWCAFCEGDFKLAKTRDGRKVIVHHGFKRPGDGYIHGDCRGVYQAPYELSCQPLVPYLAEERAARAQAQARLDALRAGEVLSFEEVDERASWRLGRGVVRQYAVGVTDAYTWERKVEREIGAYQRAVDGLTREIDRVQKLITNWKVQPVRTFEEILEVERAKKEERADVVASKRAARVAKEQAVLDKHEAAFLKREATKAAISAEAIRLAAVDCPKLSEEDLKSYVKAHARLRAQIKAARKIGNGYWFTGKSYGGAYDAREKSEAARFVPLSTAARDALVALGLATCDGGYFSIHTDRSTRDITFYRRKPAPKKGATP